VFCEIELERFEEFVVTGLTYNGTTVLYMPYNSPQSQSNKKASVY